MKNNFNPYTVPENFFENTCNQAVSRYRRRKRAVIYGISAMAVAAVLLIVPPHIQHPQEDIILDNDVVANNLASMYDYDIFLQVNFNE